MNRSYRVVHISIFIALSAINVANAQEKQPLPTTPVAEQNKFGLGSGGSRDDWIVDFQG